MHEETADRFAQTEEEKETQDTISDSQKAEQDKTDKRPDKKEDEILSTQKLTKIYKDDILIAAFVYRTHERIDMAVVAAAIYFPQHKL